MTGAPGTVTGTAGVTADERAEVGLSPTELVAVTVKVYDVPLVSPGTTTEVAVAAAVTDVAGVVALPAKGSTRYPGSAAPPAEAGAVQVTVAWALPPVTVPIVGAPGTVAGTAGVTAVDLPEVVPAPTALIAVTVNVYDVPFVSPVTTAEVAVPATVIVGAGVVALPA